MQNEVALAGADQCLPRMINGSILVMPAISPKRGPAPTRNVFDLTYIREESTLMDDSVMNAMEETVISPSMEAVVEENLEDMSHEGDAFNISKSCT